MAKATMKDLGAAAERYIEREDELVFDVAAGYGQMFDNIKHMRWFKKAVAERVAFDVKKYQHLAEKFIKKQSQEWNPIIQEWR